MGLLGRLAVGYAKTRAAALEGGRLGEERRTAAEDRRKALTRQLMIDQLTENRERREGERADEAGKREDRRLQQAALLAAVAGKRDQQRIDLERETTVAAFKKKVVGEQENERAGAQYAEQFPGLAGLPRTERVAVGRQTLAATLRPRTPRVVRRPPAREGLVPLVPADIDDRIVAAYNTIRRRSGPPDQETETIRTAARAAALQQAISGRWITEEQARSYYGPTWTP